MFHGKVAHVRAYVVCMCVCVCVAYQHCTVRAQFVQVKNNTFV